MSRIAAYKYAHMGLDAAVYDNGVGRRLINRRKVNHESNLTTQHL